MGDTDIVVLCSGEEVEILEGENRKDLQEMNEWSKYGIMKPVHGNWMCPKNYVDYDAELYNFPFRSTDVFVIGYPKSGTTWLQEIVWTILNNADLSNAKGKENILTRVPCFEMDIFKACIDMKLLCELLSTLHNIRVKSTMLDMYKDMVNPRIFKTHIYPEVMNKIMLDVAKIVYVVRDPLDSCYSYYQFHRFSSGVLGLNKDLQEFADIYIRGELYCGNAVEHILSWWPFRNNKNVYMIFYEDMKRDPVNEIRKLAKFLEKELTKEEISNVVYQTSFTKMKENSLANEDGDILKHINIDVKVTEEQSSFFRKEKVVLCSGEEVEVYDGDNRSDIQEISNWSKTGFLKPVNGKRIFPKTFLEVDDELYNFPIRSTDVFVNGYPKSGTTWVQEIVWTILHDADLQNPKQIINALMRVPFFEGDMFKHIDGTWFKETFSKLYECPVKPKFVDMFAYLPDRRVFKSHMYPSTINKDMLDKSKIVYVVRNPLDSFYSFYLFHRYMSGVMGINKDLAEFADIYTRGEVFMGNAAEHIENWWPYRGHKNLYTIFYENLKNEPAAEIYKLAEFLGKELTDAEIQNIVDRSSFKKMKENFGETEKELEDFVQMTKTEDQSSFFRKGTIGDSNNMPKDVYNKLAAYFKEYLKDLDLPYTFVQQ